MSIRSRAAAVAAVALVLGALLSGCGGQTPPASPSAAPSSAKAGSSPDRIALTFANGKSPTATEKIPIKLGRTVELVISSDVADEVHLHGYDRKVEVPAGGKATLNFVADVPGVFDVEMEKKKAPLAKLEVK